MKMPQFASIVESRSRLKGTWYSQTIAKLSEMGETEKPRHTTGLKERLDKGTRRRTPGKATSIKRE